MAPSTGMNSGAWFLLCTSHRYSVSVSQSGCFLRKNVGNDQIHIFLPLLLDQFSRCRRLSFLEEVGLSLLQGRCNIEFHRDKFYICIRVFVEYSDQVYVHQTRCKCPYGFLHTAPTFVDEHSYDDSNIQLHVQSVPQLTFLESDDQR